MKEKTLAEISNGRYYVKDCCTYKKGKGKICNFYISDLTKYKQSGDIISFEITLKNGESDEDEETAIFPISYLKDPLSWHYCGFDTDEFCIKAREKFESAMNDIINLIEDNKKYSVYEVNMGWKFKEPNFENPKIAYEFGKYEDPYIEVNVKLDPDKDNTAFLVPEYMKLTDISIGAPLMSYMLLSILTSLFLRADIKPDFNIAIVGGTEAMRKKYALFFANLYRRDPSFYKKEYRFMHILKDDAPVDLRKKVAKARDCVLIAFEPDTRKLNILLEELYGAYEVCITGKKSGEKQSIANLLLFTAKQLNKNTSENTLIIELTDKQDTKKIEEYFNLKPVETDLPNEPPIYINRLEDDLIDNIYYYIKILNRKLLGNPDYVYGEFKRYKRIQEEKFSTLDITDIAKDVAISLSFAFYLYAKCLKSEEAEICEKVYSAILQSVQKSFPTEKQLAEIEFDKAKQVCKQADSYFEDTKNKRYIGETCKEDCPNEKSVWYDEEYIYIRQARLDEFLKLTDSELKFTRKVRNTLAENNVIKTYKKDDGKLEYSVHLQKLLGGKVKTRERYVAFDRQICKRYSLFINIEKISKEK